MLPAQSNNTQTFLFRRNRLEKLEEKRLEREREQERKERKEREERERAQERKERKEREERERAQERKERKEREERERARARARARAREPERERQRVEFQEYLRTRVVPQQVQQHRVQHQQSQFILMLSEYILTGEVKDAIQEERVNVITIEEVGDVLEYGHTLITPTTSLLRHQASGVTFVVTQDEGKFYLESCVISQAELETELQRLAYEDEVVKVHQYNLAIRGGEEQQQEDTAGYVGYKVTTQFEKCFLTFTSENKSVKKVLRFGFSTPAPTTTRYLVYRNVTVVIREKYTSNCMLVQPYIIHVYRNNYLL